MASTARAVGMIVVWVDAAAEVSTHRISSLPAAVPRTSEDMAPRTSPLCSPDWCSCFFWWRIGWGVDMLVVNDLTVRLDDWTGVYDLTVPHGALAAMVGLVASARSLPRSWPLAAGIVGFFGGEFTDPKWIEGGRQEMEVNFLGTFAVTQAFAPVLAKNDGGAIANLNSVASFVGFPILAAVL